MGDKSTAWSSVSKDRLRLLLLLLLLPPSSSPPSSPPPSIYIYIYLRARGRRRRAGGSIMAENLARAEAFEKKAEKKLNGWGFLGSKHEDAADLYDKAANSFKLAKSCNLFFCFFCSFNLSYHISSSSSCSFESTSKEIYCI